MSHDRRLLMPLSRGILRLKARAFFDTMSAPLPLQSCSSTATSQSGSLVSVAPEVLCALLSEVPRCLMKRSIGPRILPCVSAWNWKSRLCLAKYPESCKLSFSSTTEHDPLGHIPVQYAWQGTPTSVRGLSSSKRSRAVHSAVCRLAREGYSSELSDAADADMENKVSGQTVESKLGTLNASHSQVEDSGETKKASGVENVVDTFFPQTIQISVPENLGVKVIDESGRVVEGWGAKAMGLIRGLLGVGETGTSSIMRETEGLGVISAVSEGVSDLVLEPSKVPASSETVPVRPCLGDLLQTIVNEGVAAPSLSRSSCTEVAAIGEERATRLETSANVRDTSLLVPRFMNEGSGDQPLELETGSLKLVAVDEGVTALSADSKVDADEEKIGVSTKLVAELEVGEDKEETWWSKASISCSGVCEDEEKTERSRLPVSLAAYGDDRKMNVLNTSFLAVKPHAGKPQREDSLVFGLILQESSAIEGQVPELNSLESLEGLSSHAVPSSLRTLEKARPPSDRRRRNAGSVNKQPTVLHDLLTVPGIGPRNREKFIAKGILKVAELKQLYKDKFRDQQSEKMVEFLKRSIGIVHKNHAISIASYIKDTVDGESENEDKAADRDTKTSQRRRLTFCVEGNISVGKTTFLQKIANETVELRDLVEVVPEPVGKWQDIGPDHFNILNAFYEEPHRYAYTFQNYVFVTRLMQERESAKGLKPLRLMERSVFSDRMVFVRAVHEAKWMSEMEISIYDSWFDPVVSVLPGLVPDAFIYMRASPDTCHRRLQMRKRPEEQTVTLDYLRDLHDKHEQWLFPAEKGGRCDILSVSEWPMGLHEGVPPRIKDRVFYLHGENVHSCIQKVPALVLDCEATIDFSRDVEAKAEYAKQVAEFFEYVRRMKDSEERGSFDETNPIGPLVLPGSNILGPDGSVMRANAMQAIDFGGQKLSSFCS